MDRTGGFCGTASSRDDVATARRTVIFLSGEHDMFTVPALSETIARATAGGEGDLVIDLQGVEFMAVATVRVLLQAQAVLQRQSRALWLRSPPVCASRVLHLCGAVDLFEPSVAVGGGP